MSKQGARNNSPISSSAKFCRAFAGRARRSLRAMKRLHPGALLLAIAVAANLTVICQGHTENHEHFGTHVTFLFHSGHGAPGQDVQAVDGAGAIPDWASAFVLSPGQLANLTAQAGGANSPALAPGGQTVSDGLSSLGFTLALSAGRLTRSTRPLEAAASLLGESQTILGPDSPPPRQAPL